MGVTSYLVIDGEIISETRSGVESDYIPDPLGSTVALINAAGTITDTFTYWPFGSLRSHVGSSVTPFGYGGTLGYYTDGSSGRTYLRARIYMAGFGRFLTAARALMTRLGERNYAYARANPVKYVDPSGKWPVILLPPHKDPGIDITLAGELCGNGDPLACKGVNDQLPTCTSSSPNYQACGVAIFGNPNAGHRGTGNDANMSDWPHPRCQISWLPGFLCWIGSEYCCMECMMRVCCYFGPGFNTGSGTSSTPEPVMPIPGPTFPGQPVKGGSSPIWE